MTSVEAAKQRLERAIARLEQSASRRAQPAGPDQAELVRALEAAQAENAALHATTEQVAGRLDRAIGRLRTVLGD
jgi:hypothetical protein